MLRTKYLTYHESARGLVKHSSTYRNEVENALERFHNLDFGLISKEDLIDNTETLASENGMLVGRYETIFGGYTNIIHNINFGKTIVTFVHVPVKCSYFGI